MDAIESGIVKIPRVPVSDDSMTGDVPTYRDLWLRVREDLPRKGRADRRRSTASPILPKELEGALRHPVRRLRDESYEAWTEAGSRHAARVHRRLLEHDHQQARLRLDRRLGEDAARRLDASPCRARLPLFSNVEDGRWPDRPNTPPRRLGPARVGRGARSRRSRSRRRRDRRVQAPSTRARFPGRSADDITDEDILREVMNTVGKTGPPRRADPLRRLGLDAHRGLGRQHRHPHPGHPRLRDPAPVRAGRRPGPPPRELRARTPMACSSPSTPRSTASRSASSRPPGTARSCCPRSASTPSSRQSR